MFRRGPSAPAVAPPDRALMSLVETTGAAARSAVSFREAVDRVVRDVADACGWAAGHALVRGDVADEWVSFGVWHAGAPCDALREVCAGAGSVRGHLALALHLEAPVWASELGALRGAAEHDGVVAAVACPVYADGRAVALLEWYLASDERPPPDVTHAIGHLSGVLSEVAERPALVPALVPAQRTYAPTSDTHRLATEEGVGSRLLSC